MHLENRYDLIVVGAGHAGCEAAYSAARMGRDVLLLTMEPDKVAMMSCNPSIGGLAKGHLVREIDALGGIQAIAADATGIQFRMLNTRKGPAVQAPRAQCDKLGYNAWMREFIANVPGLTLGAGTAVDLILERGESGRPRVGGVMVDAGDGEQLPINARAVICTTGTFLDGLIHVGLRNFPAGRMGEKAAVGLGEALARVGFETGRLKTGTPPRLRASTIDWSKFDVQPGDEPPPAFSFSSGPIRRDQVPCWIGYTNAATHEIINAGLDRSPMYTGVIEAIGPRYCPSIEDKVVRFAERPRHQIFLEPEGLTTDWIYPNGLSTSLPEDVQEALLRSIPGLENVEMIRPGYAVEYTYCPPLQLHATLQTRLVEGLFFAGQINGTSGYEEAAAQGLMAGINAALWLAEREPLILRRDEAYIGVLIDDLITMEHREPYRMFTSRAEYRLLLRHDTADLRLTPHGRRVGLIDDDRWAAFETYRERIAAGINALDRRPLHPDKIDRAAFEAAGLPAPEKQTTIGQYLARPKMSLEAVRRAGLLEPGPVKTDGEDGRRPALQNAERDRADAQILLHFKYAGYIRKQREQVERMRRLEDKPLPQTLDYARIHGLRSEAQEKLTRFRPATVGQATRIAGINPTDLSLVLVHLRARAAA